MNEEYLLSIKEKEPVMPQYEKEIHVARYYSIVFAVIIIICAIISLITNIKRKSKIRIILSIMFPIVALMIRQLLEITAFKFHLNGYKGSIATSNFFGIGILIIMFIALIVMIFKTRKENK